MIKKTALILMAIVLIQKQLPAQNYKFQALFIYNIVKRIEWPDHSSDFVIGVVDCKEIQHELESLSQKQKLGGRTIRVVSLDADDAHNHTLHALFLGKKSSSKIEEIRAKIQSKPILLIGEKPGIKGVGINFLESSKGIEFEIYPKTIASHKLNVANSLLNLGLIRN